MAYDQIRFQIPFYYSSSSQVKSSDRAFSAAFAAFDAHQNELAVSLFKKVLKYHPSHIGALNLITIALMRLGHHSECLPFISRATKLDQSSHLSFYNFGSVLQRIGRLDEAIEQFNKSLALDSRNAETWNNRGAVFNELLHYERALTDFDQAIEIDREYVGAYCNKAGSLLGLGRLDDAISTYQIALAKSPQLAEAWLGLANALGKRGNYEQSFEAYNRSINLRPNATAYNDRGFAFNQLNKIDPAIADYARAIELDPTFADAYLNKAHAHLLKGDLQAGWRLYEWRWSTPPLDSRRREFAAPLWTGEQNLAHKTVLLHSEQGLGDALQFSRYAAMVQSLAAQVILEVPEALASFISTAECASQVVVQGDRLPDVDYHCPLLSLPRAFRTTLQTIPPPTPGLKIDESKLSRWTELLGEKKTPRIGLTWSGNAAHSNDKNRSIPLRQLLEHLPPGFQYIGLQKDIRTEDREALRDTRLTHFPELLRDISDTAALIAALDVVVSVDTGVAHLSGSLNHPTWLMLPFRPDWRWLLDRSDTPWYPAMKLYRQPSPGDWASVLNQISKDLRQHP